MAESLSELQLEIEKLERKHAENPEGRYFVPLANAYRKLGSVEHAEALLREGLKKHPDYLSAHIVLGRCLADRQAVGEAVEEFRYVLSLDPQNLIALRTLGELAASAGQVQEAGRWYRELLGVDPMNEEARQALQALGLSESPSAGEAAAEGGAWRAPAAPADEAGEAGPPVADGLGLPGADGEPDSTPAAPAADPSFLGGFVDLDARGGAERASIPEEPADELAEEGGAVEVVTETIAELYARQGFYDRAAEVYRELIRRRGEDPGLRSRLAEIERLANPERGGQGGGLLPETAPAEPAELLPEWGAPEPEPSSLAAEEPEPPVLEWGTTAPEATPELEVPGAAEPELAESEPEAGEPAAVEWVAPWVEAEPPAAEWAAPPADEEAGAFEAASADGAQPDHDFPFLTGPEIGAGGEPEEPGDEERGAPAEPEAPTEDAFAASFAYGFVSAEADVPAPAAAGSAGEAAASAGGTEPSIAQYLAELAAWRPAAPLLDTGAAAAEAPERGSDDAGEPGGDGSVEDGTGSAAAEPFPWELAAAPEPVAETPGPAAPREPKEELFSFDEFLTGGQEAAAAEPSATPVAPEPAPPAEPSTPAAEETDDDLESFQAWLRSLKR